MTERPRLLADHSRGRPWLPERLIRLTPEEVARARGVTEEKRENARRRGIQERYGADGKKGFELQESGDAGEFAFARYVGEKWRPVIRKQRSEERDVGNYYVRTSRLPSGDLWIRPGDHEGIYAHVIALRPYDIFWIDGWFTRDRCRDEWLRSWTDRETGEERPPVFMIPAWEMFDYAFPDWLKPGELDNPQPHSPEGKGPPPSLSGQDRAGL